MMAHDLHDAAAVVALGGVAQLVDGLDRGVHGGIVADGVLTAGDIVIDGAGDADAGNALVGQRAGAHEGAVAADDNQRIDAQLLAAGQSLGLAGRGLELRQRAVYRMVPPRWMISETLRTFIS